MARGMGPTQRRYYEPGRLRVNVVPSSARVYVDGSFIGTVSDVNYGSGGYRLRPGSHRVSVRASGYEGSGASVWVPPGQSVMYQDYLDRPVVRYRSASYLPVSYYSRPSWYYAGSFQGIAPQGPSRRCTSFRVATPATRHHSVRRNCLRAARWKISSACITEPRGLKSALRRLLDARTRRGDDDR